MGTHCPELPHGIAWRLERQQALMLKAIKAFANRLPIVPSVYEAYMDRRRNRMSTQEIFTEIFRRNAWKGVHSVSGPGSGLDQAKAVIEELPSLFKTLGITTMLDVPCGDFYWMSSLDLGDVKYVGADIVQELVCHNKRYESDNIAFVHANLLTDELPRVDLVLCRDCLVHFSLADIHRALKNLCRSSSEYLLTSTYQTTPRNIDITTGAWRPLNLQIAPFSLPVPLRFIVEGVTEGNDKFKGKSLGLWRVGDIRDALTVAERDEH